MEHLPYNSLSSTVTRIKKKESKFSNSHSFPFAIKFFHFLINIKYFYILPHWQFTFIATNREREKERKNLNFPIKNSRTFTIRVKKKKCSILINIGYKTSDPWSLAKKKKVRVYRPTTTGSGYLRWQRCCEREATPRRPRRVGQWKITCNAIDGFVSIAHWPGIMAATRCCSTREASNNRGRGARAAQGASLLPWSGRGMRSPITMSH